MIALVASPVTADCDPVGTPEDVLPTAPVAFVGTVTTLEPARAHFTVLEVWNGNVAEAVDVHRLLMPHPHGREPAGPAEDDRAWTLGGTYLVIPHIEAGALVDHICTATVEWSDDLAALRPPDAVVHAAGEEASAAFEIPTPVLVAIAAALVVASASVLAYRRRGQPTR
jgi:hypothetical protein